MTRRTASLAQQSNYTRDANIFPPDNARREGEAQAVAIIHLAYLQSGVWLFDGDGLSQVSRLIDVTPPAYGDVIREELQGDRGEYG